MHHLDFQPRMIGREDELRALEDYLNKAQEGQGNAVFISGEAGIGKTKLVNELKQVAESKGFQILLGNSLPESITPYAPFMEALKSGGLESLFSEEAPKVEAIYLIAHSGSLVKEALRQETELNPDIFSSMLTTVGNFVRDSLSMLSGDEKKGTLNTLGYENYRILIESKKSTNLVVLLTGRENEFLIDDMRECLMKVEENYENVLVDWDGDEKKIEGIENILDPIITSGKYDGIYHGKEDPKIRRNLLFENISMGLARQSQTKPTLFCIEDLHLADPSSIALMHYIARNTKSSPLLILGTYRPEDIVAINGKSHPLVETMQLMDREDLNERLELERLPKERIPEFLSAMLGEADFTIDFNNRIFKETEGNPLFIIQLMKFLVEENFIESYDGIWKLTRDFEEAGIPSKIYSLIEKRLSKVDKKYRKVLDFASVIGEVFTSTILADALKIKRIQLLEQLRTLEQTYRLIRSYEGKHRFDHTKIKEVLYSEIPQELRMEYHAVIANSLETLNSDNLEPVIGDLAFHYRLSKNKEKALFYLMKAADRAKDDYSNEDAIRFYKQALEFEEDKNKRSMIFEALGDIYYLIGEYDVSLESYESALKITEGKKKKDITMKIKGILSKKRNYDKS